MPPSPLFTINLDNRKSPFLITHYSPVCVAIDSTKISLSIRIESLKKRRFKHHAEVKKGHNFGFKAGNVPHNKGTKGELENIVPAPYIRLSDQMFNLVSETQSTAEAEKMVLRPGCYHLLRQT